MASTLALACDLIRCPSVTPADAGCLDLLGARLAAAGFALAPLPFGEVSNLWAVRGDAGPLFCFAGHTDVVPPGPESEWRHPPFAPQIQNGILYGRGAADMKGALAAMVTAVEAFVAAHPQHPGRIGFLLTSDEEGPAQDGTARVVDWLRGRGMIPDWCLVGEPSSSTTLGDVIRNGRRGSLNGSLRVRGVQGHVAYPERADNPIHRAAPALAALAAEIWDRGNAHFPPTSFQISTIAAGEGVTNVIPGELRVLFNFRFSTAVTAAQLQARTEAILDRHGLDYALDWQLSGEPFLTPVGDLVNAAVGAVHDRTGTHTKLSTGGGTSDGRFIAALGTQVVELGLLNASIHKIDEQAAVADLELLSEIYRDVLERLLLLPR
ncbi:MAG: succinyl-diaminopimelate desuccinylase [Porticoccaceae bacterium]